MSKSEGSFDYQKSVKNVEAYPFLRKYLPVDRYLIRPAAALIVRAVFGGSITPNQLTLASFFIALAAGFTYLGKTHTFFILAGSLALLSTIFDAADGMLARAKNMTSRFGAYLDLFLDRIADFVVLSGMTLGYFKHTKSFRFLIFGLVTIALYFLQLTLYYLIDIYTRSEKSGEGAEAKSLAVLLIFVSSLVGRPDLPLIGIFLMALMGIISKIFWSVRKGKDQTTVQIA